MASVASTRCERYCFNWDYSCRYTHFLLNYDAKLQQNTNKQTNKFNEVHWPRGGQDENLQK